MRIDIISLFPELLVPFCSLGLLGRAQRRDLLRIETVDLRDFGVGKRKNVDDTPFGGGGGMIIRVDVAVAAIESIRGYRTAHKILLEAGGSRLNNKRAMELSKLDHIIFFCGRYEGVDARLADFIDLRLSLGDYVLMGGEVASMCVIEAVARFVPDVLGNSNSPYNESFANDFEIEYDQYTKPNVFREFGVPEVLLSGNHGEIFKWRKQNSILKFKDRKF